MHFEQLAKENPAALGIERAPGAPAQDGLEPEEGEPAAEETGNGTSE
jgi:hypothetical protein